MVEPEGFRRWPTAGMVPTLTFEYMAFETRNSISVIRAREAQLKAFLILRNVNLQMCENDALELDEYSVETSLYPS